MAVMAKATVDAERFDIHGYKVEDVQIEFQRVDGEIRIFVVGERVTKHYVMKSEDWPIWPNVSGE